MRSTAKKGAELRRLRKTAVNEMVRLSQHARSEWVQLGACVSILDRTDGKIPGKAPREEEKLAAAMSVGRSDEALVQIATQGSDEMDRLAACLAILERTDGPPHVRRVRSAGLTQH
jgi:hypothetical protein